MSYTNWDIFAKKYKQKLYGPHLAYRNIPHLTMATYHDFKIVLGWNQMCGRKNYQVYAIPRGGGFWNLPHKFLPLHNYYYDTEKKAIRNWYLKKSN